MNQTNCTIAKYILTISFCAFFVTLSHFKLSGQVYINEFLSSNTTSNIDEQDYFNHSDWIELYNSGNEDVDISGWYLTDNFNRPDKWQIPAATTIASHSYMIFYADNKDKIPGDTDLILLNDTVSITIQNYHLNFKLSSSGEAIGLSDSFGIVVDSVSYGMQLADISKGRSTTNINQWLFFGEPTPGQPNTSGSADQIVFASEAQFSIEGGAYPSSQTLSISCISPSAVIRYTTDGSKPTGSDNIYTAPLNITFSKVIKARVFESNKLPGPVATHTYLIEEDMNLPIISITAEYPSLWDYDYGIYKNSIKDMEIPASVELIEIDGTRQFSVNTGMQLFGTNIFQLEQKPMSFYMKSKYGDDFVNSDLFSDKNIINFKNFVLRNGGNDNGMTMLRDGIVTSLIAKQMDIDYQAYRPTAVFLNGQYWGIYNLREKMNEHYVATNHHINPDKLDILEDSLAVMEGSSDKYSELLTFIEANDLSISDNYNYVTSQIDINEYMNYIITKTYIGDWLANVNNKYWRERTNGSKWRWMIFDLEQSFGCCGSDQCTGNSLEKIAFTNSELPDWSTFLFRNLITNDNFKNEFIQRFASYLNTIFAPENVIQVIDSLRNLISIEMTRHIDRWSTDPLAIQSISSWNANVQAIRNYALCRPDMVRQHIMETFALADTFSVSIQNPDLSNGNVMINNVLITDTNFTGIYFSDVPVIIEAIPSVGYSFDGWFDGPANDSLSIDLNSDTLLIPIFTLSTSSNLLCGNISGDQILTENESPYYITCDLIVDSGVTLTIEPGTELLISDNVNIIINGRVVANGLENNPVRFMSNPESGARQPFFNPEPRWGAICIDNSSDTTIFSNIVISTASHGTDQNKFKAAISADSSIVLLDNVSITDSWHPFYSEYGTSIIKNCTLSIPLTGDIINIKYADLALVENCVLTGNDAEDTDAIDYDGINNGIIRNNKIQSFFGYNSDGIDLGEGSTGILIGGNQIFNCSDKGISIGQASTAFVNMNLIVNCAQGVGIKDSNSYAVIDHNTFYSNDFAVACFEKNPGAGGANASIINSILSGSLVSPVMVDNLSEQIISYSISDTDSLPGTNNIFGNPEFENIGRNNFELSFSSPCIDTGDPAYQQDTDGSRTDIGAYYTHVYEDDTEIIINEINYNSDSVYDMGDWTELYNNSNLPIDISGWSIFDENDDNYFIIPEGTVLGSDNYIVVCQDTSLLSGYINDSASYIGNLGFGFGDNESVRLFDNNGVMVNYLRYDNNSPWPDGPDGKGMTLELTLPHFDNAKAESWHPSYVAGGTPGKINSTPASTANLYINEVLADNRIVCHDEYNQYDDWVELYNASDQIIDIGGLYLTNDPENPCKWQIPFSYDGQTQIAPKGYLILWADKSPEQGLLHLNFKLEIWMDMIGLVQVSGIDTLFVDSLTFYQLDSDTPDGRYPDGSNYWMNLYPTPGASNIPEPRRALDHISINPNPARGYFNLTIDHIINEKISVELYDAYGRFLSSNRYRFHINQTTNRVDIPPGLSGLCIVKIIRDDVVRVKKVIVVD